MICEMCRWGGDTSAIARVEKRKKSRKILYNMSLSYHRHCKGKGCTCQHRNPR